MIVSSANISFMQTASRIKNAAYAQNLILVKVSNKKKIKIIIIIKS